ncbi:DUF6029 family protein [Jiulongibacter sp. NS-SX5]|uniref:DUF6029 family protein n=1 Tax=Jiulongibacter sp. NS-SX5 TaxID=3463854 RepID=UPI004057E71D
MNTRLSPLFTVFICLAINNVLLAQFSGNSIAETQLGQLPNDVNNIATFYARTALNYRLKSFRSSGTLEQFYSPRDGSTYFRLSQMTLQYKKRPFDLKIGNFYETIGRGSLVRSFEIPGAILEDLSYRSRHYFNRNILGLSAKYRYKGLTTKLIVGSPLNYVLPPTLGREVRRTDKIAALYADYNFKQQTVGAAFMRHFNDIAQGNYFMTTASGNIGGSLSYYTEFAKNVSGYDLSDFSRAVPYVFYGGLNFAAGSFGISAEYKNYNNFSIGSGINEPPALVKEHTSRVLNRSTHVLQPLNESGYQIEAFYTFPNLSSLTFNNTLAINDFGNKTAFREYYLEYDFTAVEKHDVKLFADYANDPFKSQKNRISTGLYMDWKLSENYALNTNYEFQRFSREEQNFENHVLVAGLSYKLKFVGSLVAETSNDSFIVDDGTKFWLGVNLKYQLNRSHNIQLFAGERRGGPACNAGVCYEVLDFKGLEIRLTNRF